MTPSLDKQGFKHKKTAQLVRIIEANNTLNQTSCLTIAK